MAWLLVVATVVILVTIATKPGHYYQWDFDVYYHAAQMDMHGENAYDVERLAETTASNKLHPFAYPPMVLKLFRPLAWLDYSTAFLIWLAIKTIALIGLLIVWRQILQPDDHPWLFYLFALIGFGGALTLDMTAGNVSIIEQVFLWSAFLALLRRRTALFCILLLASAVFKWTPILFVLLLPVTGTRHWPRYLAAVGLAFIAIVAADYFAHPEAFRHFIASAVAVDERGVNLNPSILALVKDLTGWLNRMRLQSTVLKLIPYALWLGIAYAVLRATIKRFTTSHVLRSGWTVLETIYLSTVVYALIMPRFKLYSFALVLPAVFFVIMHRARASVATLLIILVAISAPPTIPSAKFFTMMVTYYPLLLLFGLWWMWLSTLSGEVQSVPDSTVSAAEADE